VEAEGRRDGRFTWRGCVGSIGIRTDERTPATFFFALPACILLASRESTRTCHSHHSYYPVFIEVPLFQRLLFSRRVASPCYHQNAPDGLVRYSIAACHLAQGLALCDPLHDARPFRTWHLERRRGWVDMHVLRSTSAYPGLCWWE
jgi:hypothetical protein